MNYLLFVLAVLALTVAAQQRRNCTGAPNSFPVYTEEPVLVATVKNGKRYLAGAGNDAFHLLHLWGTPYEQGFAQGQLMADVIQNISAMINSYIEQALEQKAPFLPPWLVDLVVKYGAPFVFHATFTDTSPFTPQRYIDEMQGIADGAGVPVEIIQNFNMFPETTKAACTIVGATGPATSNHMIAHLRGLDFDADCPMKDQAQVTVYHSNDAKVPDVATVGWSGMVGALTGISSGGIGIGEKVWLQSEYDGTKGEPWMFILRDVMMQRNMDAALNYINTTKRTCAIHAGIGDSTTNTFRGVEMAANAFEVFNDTSINYPQHPILPGIVYWDKVGQPSPLFCLSDLLREDYGKIEAETLALKTAAISQTGSFHSVAFDYEHLIGYVANARKTTVTEGDLNAYNRTYTYLNFAKLFAEQP